MTDEEIKALQDLWIQIAPSELFDYAATCLEKKGLFELQYDIPDFFAPSDDGPIYHVSDQIRNDEDMWRWKHA